MSYLFKVLLFLIAFTGLHNSIIAQVSGQLLDAKTKEPLAFAHIIINNTQNGTLTDIDGKFKIPYKNIESITVSYIGYQDKTIQLNSAAQITILLERSSELLNEVVINEGENPAIPILKKAIANKELNDPENLPYFSFETYNKFSFVLHSAKSDTSYMANFWRKSNLFLMESVSEKKYLKPGKYNEKIIANKISGFKNPTFTTFANGIQPFSFYDDYILLFGSQFTNPLGKPGMKKYNYYLEDSISTDHGKIYIILFEPRKNNEKQLSGFLHISNNKWALENVIAQSGNYTDLEAIDSNIAFKIQQKYELKDEKWFPKQLNTNMKSQVDGGQTIEGIGSTYLSKINFEKEITKKDVGRIVLSFDQEANKRDSSYWRNRRFTALTSKEIKTYETIDSIGKARNFDRLLIGLNAIILGQIKIGKIGLDLNRILDFNRYEGIRLGAGIHTNKDFSEYIKVGGYFGYGFRDKGWKYGGDIQLNLSKQNDLQFFAAYSRDVNESGGTNFYLEDKSFSALNDRKILVNNFDKADKITAGFRFYWLKYLDTELSVSNMITETTSGYQYLNEGVTNSTFNLSETSIKLRYAPKLQYIESFFRKIPVYDHKPVFWINFTKGSNFLKGEFDYTKLVFKMFKSSKIKKFGAIDFSLIGQKVFGDAPYPVLFNGYGTYYEKFGLETQNGFQTMRINEFLSDEFYGLFTNIYLGKIEFIKKYSKPTFNIRHNMGWGKLKNQDRHQDFDFKTLNDGFIESGLSISNLLISNFSGLGLGIYYRYGANSFDNASDNLVFKFNTSITFN